jgi:hypothetical protein
MELAVPTRHFSSFRVNLTFIRTERSADEAGPIGIATVRVTKTENRDFLWHYGRIEESLGTEGAFSA